MPNTKSAKKRVKTNEKSRERNIARRSDIKSSIKNFKQALEENNIENAQKLLKTTSSKISRAAGKGIFKKNKASRKISRLTKALIKLKK
ncbi:30S ribosomal protein S20 [Candidatus Babeliales bacterium]|nr:30S ribosomal protein S20 [Candidatus Babeliales bacterium]